MMLTVLPSAAVLRRCCSNVSMGPS
jgi:hypothetical protein